MESDFGQNPPRCHRCTSRGGKQTPRQTLSSSVCDEALAPGPEDDVEYYDNDDDSDGDDETVVQHLGDVPEQAHHVAQQVGFLREPLLALRKSWSNIVECFESVQDLIGGWVDAEKSVQ